ncbi:hypothetical protein WJX73_010580 [Symbiochloris irregularis]|uniref:Uncharacterized protein n=1 Tax=Symbiochloris irregularis TaxID=706552 RepID=A0AAW1PML3_9CHLO
MKLEEYEQHKPQIATYPDLAGRRVLITGGSAGIGRATAHAFSANGAVVTIVGRRLERLQKVVEALPGKAFAIAADLTKKEDLERIVKEAVEHMGGLDALVNNGANGECTEEFTRASCYERHFQLHVTSAVTLIGAALPYLKKKRGSVVNVSSILSVMPSIDDPSYSVAKAAQDKMTENWALKFARDGVRINAIRPGCVMTEVYETWAEREGRSLEDLMDEWGAAHAMGRVSTPEEQAAVILFLSSASASYITGASIRVDGGSELGFWYNKLELDRNANSSSNQAIRNEK